MALTPAAVRFSPETRTSAFYFTFFMAGGSAVTFLPIWLTEKGITPDQIGIINAMPILLILASNLLVGRLADRASDWRQVIIIGSLTACVVPVGLFFVNGFWGALLIWSLSALPNGAIAPVIDAATMRMTRRNGSDFGTIRAWGTVGYMLFNGLTGFLVLWFGSEIFAPLFVGLTLLRAVASLILPRFRAPPTEMTIAGVRKPAGRIRQVLKPWFLLPLLCFSMIFATHIVLNAFGALLWKQQGIPETIIGALIALAGLSEAAMMFAWKWFSGRVSARQMILLAAIGGVVRWFVMGFSPPIAVLILLQIAHSVTYSLGFLGSVHFIANWTHEDVAAEAQSLFTMGQQAVAVLTLVLCGWLVTVAGPHVYFASSALAAVGAVCVWLSLKLQQPKAVVQG